MIQPPTTGPMIGAITTPMPKIAMAMPCSRRGKVSSKMAWESGWSPPPPNPCKILDMISTFRDGAAPHRRDAAVKRKSEKMR